jgi:hypothetical protein
LEWKQAIQDEYDALIKNGTWTLVDRKDVPKGVTIHRSIWRLKTKLDGQRKARLCFDGRSQEKGVDYEKVFAPTPDLGSIRAILTMMAEHCEYKVQGDVPNAFLIPPIDVDIYMELPEGYVGDRSKVCKLLKGLYGTKQASRLFYHEISDFLRNDLGMFRSEVNPCLFTLTVPDGIVIVLMYVDDVIIGGSSESIAQPIVTGLTRKYNVRWSDQIGLFLGIQCEVNDVDRTITMCQPHIVDHLLSEYNLENARNVRSSANPSVDITDEKSPPADEGRYREVIGKLLWIARCTRPDVLFRVIQLAQYVSRPTMVQWGAILHLIRYLGATRDYGIVLNQTPSHILTLYTDASHGDRQMDRKSVTGYVLFINGSPVDWCSRKQKSIAISTAEAEYVAISDSLRDVRPIAMMIEETSIRTGFDYDAVIKCHTDSSACVQIIERGSIDRGRTKHIDVRQHWILEAYQRNEFQVYWIDGSSNTADVLTKVMKSVPDFERHARALVRSVTVRGSVGRYLDDVSFINDDVSISTDEISEV